jgi:hypothetical protein
MRRSVGVAAVAVMLGPVGCQGGDQAAPNEQTASVERATTSTLVTTPPEAPLTAEEKLLGWIRSCDARMIIFAHNNRTYVRFRGGASVWLRIRESAAGRIWQAANAQSCHKRISVGIE